MRSAYAVLLFTTFISRSAFADNAQVRPEIVSAWVSPDSKSLLIFSYNGTYQHVIDSPTSPGIERGKFEWQDNGTFTAQTIVDTNGTLGVSHPGGAMTIAIASNTLTLTTSGSPTQTFSRVVKTASGIVGSWYEPGHRSSVTFLSDNTYFLIEEEDDEDGYDGMERGVYTWNATTKVVTATPSVDTNGSIGLGSLPPGFTITVTGDTFAATDGGDTQVFNRLVTTAAPLPLPIFGVAKIAFYQQTSAANPIVPTGDSHGVDVYIDPGVAVVSPQLKIGSRAAVAFEEDEGHYNLEYDYPSKAAMDTAFPENTNLQFLSGGNVRATLKYPATSNYPSIPKLIADVPEDEDDDEISRWENGTYQFSEDAVLRWTPPTGFNPATDLTFVELESLDGYEDVEQVIQGDVSVLDLKDMLEPGTRYEVNIEFVRFTGTTTISGAPFTGHSGSAVYSTKLQLQAVSEDYQPVAPHIERHPESRYAVLGSQVTLTASADGGPHPTYQWFKNGNAIPGQTGTALTFREVKAGDYASYSVTATNSEGFSVSNAASIIQPGPFDAFIFGVGLDPLTNGQADTDNDRDGIVNLMEFVLGGNPLVADRNRLPLVTVVPDGSGGRNLTVKYPLNTDSIGLTPVIETSQNLQPPWTVAAHHTAGVLISSSPIDAKTNFITVTIPMTGARNFARLRVGPTSVINLATSYLNFKESGLQPQNLPSAGASTTHARGYGNFFGDGSLGLFTATLKYDHSGPVAGATQADFAFWRRQGNGTFIKDGTLLSGTSGCIHPRKALVADFNGDGKPDVFVACHGYDAPPFPGETNRVVLSQPNGTYQIQAASHETGFFHGATAADVDTDGDIDVITVRDLAVFLNRGNGTFDKDIRSRLPDGMLLKNYFSVELMDVDGDTVPDLVAGGHEWEAAPTRVYINPGNFNFAGVIPVEIPSVPNDGVVLDFTISGAGPTRALWVLRTSGGDGTFYQGRTVQKVLWPSLQSSLPLRNRSLPWIEWLIPTSSGGIPGFASDNANISSFIAR